MPIEWAPMPLADVSAMMAGSGARWWLSGGCAIDHWLGHRTREHGDIDVSTLRPDLDHLVAALRSGLTAHAAVGGRLTPLRDQADLHNVWVLDVDRDRWVLQVNVEDGDADVWRYRRDQRISRPWPAAVDLRQGVPTGTPATQLLWKARGPRPCDDHDLAATLPMMGPAERLWLRDAIRTAHPESPWLDSPALAAR